MTLTYEERATLRKQVDVATRKAARRWKPTKRGLQILQLAADGYTNRAIAEELGLSEETVKTHLRKLYPGLGASSRSHAVAIGIRKGLIG